ncbi:MAG: class I SAM-dependent rRNA methyltransferase [Flavobacteriales bacterium]
MEEIYLKKGKDASIRRKHPWIFSGAIGSDTSKIDDGSLVRVCTSNREAIAVGHFQHGSISVRILRFDDQAIDLSFWKLSIQSAWKMRLGLGLLSAKNNIFRLIHGEGDHLPGLVIDYYGGVCVIQCHSIGMLQSLTEIASALKEVLGHDLKAIYHKSKGSLPRNVVTQDGYLWGMEETPFQAIENNICYTIDWVLGQKTGFFIDQRENRKLLGQLSTGKKVLNAFCYSGGFSLEALINGASDVYSLDSSEKAIALTEANLALNTFKGKHVSVVADAMEYLKALPEPFDIIVLDPPAFAKHLDKKHKAVQGYKRLNAHALRQIKPGGILFTFSCSQVIDKALFTHTIIAASIESGRQVRILYQMHQPLDHPISAYHPEGEYLKGLVLYVE